MNLKNFEQDYIKFTDSSVPDTEKLWEKISNAPDSDSESDITPFLSASEQCRASGRNGNVIKIFAAVAAVFIAVVGYVLIKGIPQLKPSLFAWNYTTDNVSMMPAIITTIEMVGISLLIAAPLGICCSVYLTEYAKGAIR